jgi:hypothetical protein
MKQREFLAALGCLLLAPFALSGCSSEELVYQPAEQILPVRIHKIAIRPVVNKAQQFGLEDKLTMRIRDEFLHDGRYPLVPENQADGLVVVIINRYILVPTQYDSVLTPTTYKLLITVDLQFVDRTTNTILWTEPNMQGIQIYTAPTLAGGITEEQARVLIWDVLARDIVKRTIDGFGAASGISQRRLSGQTSTGPQSQEKQSQPVNPNPY